MSESNWRVVVNEQSHLVVNVVTGQCLGGFGSNFYRPWVFPLYTPAGRTVVQEFPFDHPFHNGVFVAQNPVTLNGETANFWAAPPRRGFTDKLFQRVGRMDAPGLPESTVLSNGVRFTLQVVWRNEREEPVLDEQRSVALYSVDDATICEVQSRKIASSGEISCDQTKFGSIGIRVEPRLLPVLGGVVLADHQRRGNAEVVHEGDSTFVAYASERDGAGFGVLLTLGGEGPVGPWFIRDYGMALYNPTWREAIIIPHGQSWTLRLRVVAFDGVLDDDRAGRWVHLPWQLNPN